MDNIWFWVWLVSAVTLMVAEIFTAGFFMMPFGLSAAAAAVLAYLGVDLVWQWVAFVGLSALLLPTLRKFADRMTHEPPQKVAGDRLIGRTGIVIEDIDVTSGTGRVRVDREEWRADPSDDVSVAEGTTIRVVSVEGAHLVIEPAPSRDTE